MRINTKTLDLQGSVTVTTFIFIIYAIAIFFLVVAFFAGVIGWAGPQWVQRLGNLVVVLSIVPLLIKNEVTQSSSTSVYADLLEPTSFTLAILGAFWAGFGDVVIEAIKRKSLNEVLREKVKQ